MLDDVMTMVSASMDATSVDAAARALSEAVVTRGATFVQVRHYRRPHGKLTSAAHWQAGGFVNRISQSDWIGRPSSNYVCFDMNPLLAPIAQGRTRWRFSDYAPHHDKRFGVYWDAMSEGGIGEAVAAVAYGSDRAVASFHIGFAEREPDPTVSAAAQTAAAIVAERMMALAEPTTTDKFAALSGRERDAIAFVADGKTDWEIATIMGIAEPTARFHVDNARRKLGATNRAQAVARFVANHGHY